jgi:hypothetical protein
MKNFTMFFKLKDKLDSVLEEAQAVLKQDSP